MSAIVDDIGWGGVGEEPPVDVGYTAYEGEQRPQEVPTVDEKKVERPPDKPRHTAARQDGSDVLTMLWGGIGTALVRTGADPPVGRTMQFQAGLAGNTLDLFFAGTLLDKFIIQPLARTSDKVGTLGAILGGPLLVAIYERNEDTGPLLEGFIRAIIEDSLIEMAPLVTKKARRTRKAAEAIAEMQEQLNIPKDVDPIDAVLHMIFQPEEPIHTEEEVDNEGTV